MSPLVPYPCIAVKEVAACNNVCCEDADAVQQEGLDPFVSNSELHDPEPFKVPEYESSKDSSAFLLKHYAN